LHSYRGDGAAATTDLRTGLELARSLRQTLMAAKCAHNLGFQAGRSGDVPEALRWFDEARAAYATAGLRAGLAAVLAADRAEVLLAAGLTDEARRRAETAAAALLRDGNATDGAEAQLLTARIMLAGDDAAAAAVVASEAVARFRRQRRGTWELL